MEIESTPPSTPISETFSDTELLNKDFTDQNWIVPYFIPPGLTLLAGPPKVGKTVTLMGIASAVACGGLVFGKIDVEKKEVLYFALEDTERRLKANFSKIHGNVGTGMIHFATSGPKQGESTVSCLERHLGYHPGVKLIIIDTLARFCGYKRIGSYEGAYSQLADLKSVADKYSIAIIAVHHVRKLKAGDVFETVMGSTGITGAADTIAVMRRDGNAHNEVDLAVVGRDVEENAFALRFEPQTLTWKLLGPANEVRMSEERRELLSLLRNQSREMKLQDIVDATGKKKPVLSKLLRGLIDDGLVQQPGYGVYKAVSTNGGESANPGESGESSESGESRLEGEAEGIGEDKDFEKTDDESTEEAFPGELPLGKLLDQDEASDPNSFDWDLVNLTNFSSAEGLLEEMN